MSAIEGLDREQTIEQGVMVAKMLDDTPESIISLPEIVRRIWAGRWVTAVLILLSVFAVGALAFLRSGFESRTIVYYVELKGIDRSLYPGGAAFSPQDLKSPEVLRASCEGLGIDVSALDEIASALRIEYSSPETPGILKLYKERLAAGGLSAAELEALNKEFKEELELATRRGLRLEIDPAVAALGKQKATQLLREIPVQWSRIYSAQYRIFEPPELESVSFDIEPPLSEPASLISAMRAMETVTRGLKVMSGDNRVSYLVNPGGYSPSELARKVEIFNTTQLKPLFQAVLSRPEPVPENYRHNLRLQIEFLKSQIASYNVMIKEIVMGRKGATSEWTETAEKLPVSQLQLSGDSLGGIIDLAERASSAAFLREVMLDRHELAIELASAELELAQSEAPSLLEPGPEYVAGVSQGFVALVAEYETLRRIAVDKLRAEIGTLYDVSAAPVQETGIGFGRVLTRLIGAVLAALFVGILFSLARPLVRGSLGPSQG